MFMGALFLKLVKQQHSILITFLSTPQSLLFLYLYVGLANQIFNQFNTNLNPPLLLHLFYGFPKVHSATSSVESKLMLKRILSQ